MTLAKLLIQPQPKVTEDSVEHVRSFLQEDDARKLRKVVAKGSPVETLLAGIQHCSPFLWRLIFSRPDRAASLLALDPKVRIAEICAAARSVALDPDEASAMETLRKLRAEAALLIAMCDLGGIWTVDQVIEELSEFADACVQGAFGFVLAEAIADGAIVPPDRENPTANLGMFVLALGKHGARELNYSSDIDLTVFFDPDARAFAACKDPLARAIKMVKRIVRLLSDRNADGYVHRVDLRLRPDPGSTPIVIPIEAALTYYETVGQNWERAAMIKARPIAGDIAAGDAFLKELIPFIWRKYFDYATISDIHAMKRQIYAVKGHETIAIAGHDVKVGRGGIREVEFFVQTQQLVYGGRRPSLRGRQTLTMLQTLRDDGWVTEEAKIDLSEAYRFLRSIEHRIQMVSDEQTQRLPSGAGELERFAAFCGYSVEEFSQALTKRLLAVESHYARLFEATPGLASKAGSLVFTGVDDDPETLETLRKLGFGNPSVVAETVRGWHFGRRAAVTTPRARENLTELVPALLESFGNASDPDAALHAFDTALGKMPAAVELFSILKNHPGVRSLFAEILGSAPRLADIVSRAPHVLDILVDAGLARGVDGPALEARLATQAAREPEFELFLELIRVVARHEHFLVATQVVSNVISPMDAGHAHSTIADALLRIVLARTVRELAVKHGIIPGAQLAVIGYGKLGSREMTATSDLDLVLIYDAPADETSDGQKPLFASEWYARLMSRLIAALSANMRSGTLYEIDVRLRPSGRKGPLAVSIAALENYQLNEAEIWEHMALSRARPVAGDPELQDRIRAIKHKVIGQPRDRKKLAREIAKMRALISQEKAPEGPFDLKLMPGGIVDVEFIAQFLTLAFASEHPQLIDHDTIGTIELAGDLKLIAPEVAEQLRNAHELYARLTQFLRIVLVDDRQVARESEAFRRKLSQAAGLPSYEMLLAEIEMSAQRVRKLFKRIIGPVPS